MVAVTDDEYLGGRHAGELADGWLGNAFIPEAADTFQAADHTHTVLVHPSGAGG